MFLCTRRIAMHAEYGWSPEQLDSLVTVRSYNDIRLIIKSNEGLTEANRSDVSLTVFSCKTKQLVKIGQISSRLVLV